jgi:hypothetical protein
MPIPVTGRRIKNNFPALLASLSVLLVEGVSKAEASGKIRLALDKAFSQ